jgi:hypothetical protein
MKHVAPHSVEDQSGNVLSGYHGLGMLLVSIVLFTLIFLPLIIA